VDRRGTATHLAIDIQKQERSSSRGYTEERIAVTKPAMTTAMHLLHVVERSVRCTYMLLLKQDRTLRKVKIFATSNQTARRNRSSARRPWLSMPGSLPESQSLLRVSALPSGSTVAHFERSDPNSSAKQA
jgi:hypothetical protein